MPATPPPDVRRGKVPQALFWAGMGLAPLAVLILLFGQSDGALRIAVVLAVLTIVLLAVSIAMRPSVDMVRVDIEHRVLDEMERIRLRTREETSNVARHSHKALADRIGVLTETVEHLRAQVDEVQANAALFDPAALAYHAPAAIEPPAPPGTIRRTETVQVTRRTTYDDTGTLYGSRAAYERGAVDGEWREERDRDQPDDRWSIGRPDPPALPPAWGEGAGRFYDRPAEHEPYAPERMARERDRGYERDGYDRDRDRGYDRDRDSGGYDPRDRGHERDRGYGERDRGYGGDRGYERDRDGYGRDRGYDRDRDGYDRDRDGYDRDRGYDRGYERDRGYDREPDRGWHDDRGRDRGSDRGYDRMPEREPYDRRSERDPGYDRPRRDEPRGYEPRGHEPYGYEARYEPHGYDGDGGRGYDRYDREPDHGRPPVPRPRYPQW